MNLEEPIRHEDFNWPAAELDPVARMRAIAAALPHVAIDETVFEVPFSEFWPFIEDLESNTPRFEGAVSRLRIVERSGERLKLATRSPIGIPVDFDCVLRTGWCLMSSKLGQVGMAARPESATSTRFVHFERATRFSRLARPFFSWNIRQDFRRIRSLLTPSR